MSRAAEHPTGTPAPGADAPVPVLRVRDLGASVGGQQVVEHVDLDVAPTGVTDHPVPSSTRAACLTRS